MDYDKEGEEEEEEEEESKDFFHTESFNKDSSIDEDNTKVMIFPLLE